MAWKNIDRESGSRNLASGGAVVVTHTPTAQQVGLPARVTLSMTGLDADAQVLTVAFSQGSVLCGQTVDIDVPSSLTAYKTDVLLPSLDGTSAAVQISSDNAGDTAVTVTAELAVDTAALEAGPARSLIQASGGSLTVGLSAATSVYDILGEWPVAGRADCEALINQVADTWLAMCPVEQGTTYWFDAQNGSDSNNGTSPATPKQTVTAINTATAAGVTVRLKGTFRTGTVIDVPAGCTLTNWEGEAWPRITGARLTIDANTAAWTLATGTSYTTTLANASSLHMQGTGPFRHLTEAASTGEVDANVNSYFISSNVIRVNIGADPNPYAWECNHSSDYGSSASGIEISGHGSRVENVICDMNGFGILSTGENQSYGVKCLVEGEEVCVVRNAVCAGHQYHNIGTVPDGSGSGGRVLWENVSAGGCRHNSATHINFYAGGGANEGIARRCSVITDRTPTVGMAVLNEQTGFFGHTTTGFVGFVGTVDCWLSPDGQDPPQEFGVIGNPPTDTGIESIRMIHLRPKQRPSYASRTVPIYTGNAYVNPDIRILPADSATQSVQGRTCNGWLIGGRYEVDWTHPDTITSGSYGLIANAIQGDTKIIGSHIHFKNGNASDRYMFNRTSSTANTWAISPQIVNNVFTSDNNGAIYLLALGNVGSPDGVYDSNAIYGFTDEGTGERGYSTWDNTITLSDAPVLDAPDYRLLGLGSSLGSIVEVDALGRPLASPGETVGPWGAAAQILLTGRLPLSPTQQTQLVTASLALPAEDYVEPLDAAEVQTAAEDAIDAKLPSGATMIAGAGASNETLDDVTNTVGTGTPLAERPSAPNRTRKVRRSIDGGLTFDAITVRLGDSSAVWCLDFATDLAQGTGIASVADPTFDADTGLALTDDPERTGDRPSKGVILKFDPTTAGTYTMTMEVTYGDSQGTHTVQGTVTVLAGAE